MCLLWRCGVLSLQLFEANRVKFYMLNEVSEMIGHHGQVFRKWEKQHDMMLRGSILSCLMYDEDEWQEQEYVLFEMCANLKIHESLVL